MYCVNVIWYTQNSRLWPCYLGCGHQKMICLIFCHYSPCIPSLKAIGEILWKYCFWRRDLLFLVTYNVHHWHTMYIVVTHFYQYISNKTISGILYQRWDLVDWLEFPRKQYMENVCVLWPNFTSTSGDKLSITPT